MGIRLFPEHFLGQDRCFGLFKMAEDGALDLPITIPSDGRIPLHIVHSDPDHLAYLAGLLVLQAWLYGIDELEVPPTSRRPLLIITDTPGRFAEAYLNLHVPAEEIRRLYKQRRIALWEKLQKPTRPDDAREWLDKRLREDDGRTKLHNFFPAKQVLHANAKPRPIASRDHLGRGDIGGAAIFIIRSSRQMSLVKLEDGFRPFLILIDADGVAIPESRMESPTVVYHESVFAPELTRKEKSEILVCCLPDARFERFCAQASLKIVEPKESESLHKAWTDVDSALFSLLEAPGERKNRVLAEICRIASRLRSVLLGLSVGIDRYEQALIASGQPEALWYSWSVTQPLHALENKLPEVGGVGEWEEYVVGELVSAFQRLIIDHRECSPKHAPLVSAVNDVLARGRRVVVTVQAQAVAHAVGWLARLPEPYGLGLDEKRIRVVTPSDLSRLEPDEDCIVPQAFDPHDVFSSLAKAGPRAITLILLQNELRFVGERFLRARGLFPEKSLADKILRPICDQVERLPAPSKVVRRDQHAPMLSDVDFDIVSRMFTDGRSGFGYETVLADDESEDAIATEVEASLVRLEGNRAVFLAAHNRITYVDHEDVVCRGDVDSLEPGHRLIVVRPEAREFIADKILSTRRLEESGSTARKLITSWQEELRKGMERCDLSYAETLRRIQALGSQRCTTAAIQQWVNGEVLGPLDPRDLQRLAEAVQSQWLTENWQKVAFALTFLRSGHRLLGHRITRIIQSAAVGEYNLSQQDEEFLGNIGISFGQLQDAVFVLEVEGKSQETRTVPSHQLGTVVTV